MAITEEQKNPMTQAGYDALQEELKNLVEVERPGVVDAIAEARSHGDLSENAEYHAAKERQAFVEKRISELEEKLRNAQVIDIASIAGDDVKFGATLSLLDEDSDEEIQYRIVGSDEADVKKGLLSITSPLARALIGKRVGDEVEVSIPSGSRTYLIQKIQYIEG